MTYRELKKSYEEQTGKKISLQKISKLTDELGRLPSFEELSALRKNGRPSKFDIGPIAINDYAELFEKANRFNSTTADRIRLFQWFERFGARYWNGESYICENSLRLYPIENGVGEPDDDGEYDDYEIVDAVLTILF